MQLHKKWIAKEALETAERILDLVKNELEQQERECIL
jgi:HEPN domain-containing protein